MKKAGTWANNAAVKTFGDAPEEAIVGIRKARCEIASPTLGKTLTLVAGSTGQFYPHLDNVVLTVTSNLPSIDPRVLSLASGSHTVMVYGREAGTQLDSLRFVEGRTPPVATVSLNATANVDSGLNADVAVEFSASVTGLETSGFTLVGATAASLTGSGSSYTRTVTPTGSTVEVTLPADSVVEGNAVSNTVTITVNLPYVTQVEAEDGTLAGGMVIANDVGASNGSHIWLPEGTALGNESALNPANSATFTFNLPYAGNWILEGLLRSDNTSSNSLWVKVEDGSTYNWNTNEGSVGDLAYHWDQLSHTPTAMTTLVGVGVSNGDFEMVAGATGSLAKVAQWHTTPDIDNWKQFSGPSTDSGPDDTISAGVREAFFQGGNHALNDTTTPHTIAAGDVISFSFERTSPGGRGPAEAQLASWDGSTVGNVTAFGTAVNSGTVNGVYAGSYTVTAADTSLLGKELTIIIGAPAGSNYPEVDNVVLTVESSLPPQDPVILNLAAGTHTVTVYAQEDGTRLDALRFVPESGEPATVILTAPDVVVGSGNVDVAVDFSAVVTGLTTGDFTVSGATIAGHTGSGASYTLTLSPVASSVSVTLPLDSVVEVNLASNTKVITVRTAFEQWAVDKSLPSPANYGDDTNGDGLTYLHEFLLNLDPNTYGAPVFNPANGPTGLPGVTAADLGSGVRRLQIEFPLIASYAAEGFQYVGQFSDDMVTWEDVTGGTVAADLGSGWDHVRIEDTQKLRAARPDGSDDSSWWLAEPVVSMGLAIITIRNGQFPTCHVFTTHET